MSRMKRDDQGDTFYQDVEDICIAMCRNAVKHAKLPLLYLLADLGKGDGNVVVSCQVGVSRPDLARILRECAEKVEKGDHVHSSVEDN